MPKSSYPLVVPKIAPAFANSWVNFGGGTYKDVSYWRDRHGIVHLEGLMKSGVIGSAAFTLPSGYRPELQEIFAVSSNGLFGVLEIQADGQVIPTIGSNVYVSLSGLKFRAAP